MRPGEHLRDLRERLGIATRGVEQLSRKIAEAEGDDKFYVSNTWLTQIENKGSVPSIFKLYSLSAIYHVKFTDLLLLFGVDLESISKHQLATPLDKTHLAALEVYDRDRIVSFPIRFDQGFNLERTSLLSRMVEIWGEVPISIIQHLDLRRGTYGYVGLKDFTLSPLLRPGSFVQIDVRQDKTQMSAWRTEFDRPIYFIELRDGYACSWCDLQGNRLTLVPHPLSPCSIRQFTCPTEAEIIGRVTAVAMRIVNYLDPASRQPARLPGRS